MRRSLVGMMRRAYADPREAMATWRQDGLSEARALFMLMIACGLLCVASLPAALRRAYQLGIEDGPNAVVAAHLFAYFFVAPLLAYAGAAVAHLLGRACGGTGSFLASRTAVFWAMLLGAPLVLLLAAVAAVAGGPAPWLGWLGYAALAVWIWLLAASLGEAEGFRTVAVAAVVVLFFAAIVGALRLSMPASS